MQDIFWMAIMRFECNWDLRAKNNNKTAHRKLSYRRTHRVHWNQFLTLMCQGSLQICVQVMRMKTSMRKRTVFLVFSQVLLVSSCHLVMGEINLFEALNQFNIIFLTKWFTVLKHSKHFTLLMPAGIEACFCHWIKDKKKGNCDFLSCNSDFFLRMQLRKKKSQNCEIKSRN